MRDQENIAKQPYFAQTGWSVRQNVEADDFAELTTPSAPTKEASQHLITVASTPPLRRGILPDSIHSQLYRPPLQELSGDLL